MNFMIPCSTATSRSKNPQSVILGQPIWELPFVWGKLTPFPQQIDFGRNPELPKLPNSHSATRANGHFFDARSSSLQHGPRPWSFELVTGRFEVKAGQASGTCGPHFEILRLDEEFPDHPNPQPRKVL